MEIDLKDGTKEIKRRLSSKGSKLPKRRKEAQGKGSLISKRALIAIVFLLVLLGISTYYKASRGSVDKVEDGVEYLEPELDAKGSAIARLGECDIEYSTGLWSVTDNGLEARCGENGYYRVSFDKESLLGTTIKEEAELKLKSKDGINGLMLGSLNYDGSGDSSCTRAEISYSRIELNHNNIVTGNTEKTREVFLQPSGTQECIHITITSYETKVSSYTVYEEDLENIFTKLVEQDSPQEE